MKENGSYQPLGRDLDQFLFASVGDEIDGVPLSVISALTRLGVDPWEESSHLSSLGKREATEQLARLIFDLPGRFHTFGEARETAGHLASLLPRHVASATSKTTTVSQIRMSLRLPTWLPAWRVLLFWGLFALLVITISVTAFTRGGSIFGTSVEKQLS